MNTEKYELQGMECFSCYRLSWKMTIRMKVTTG